MAKRIVFFNHKGGVSKTTSAYNIGWMMAGTHRVLLVDADPQCNLTALFLRDDFEKYYTDDLTKSQNIKDGVSPAFDGRPVPIQAVDCFRPKRAPQLHVLAGHANLSAYDAALTFAQTSNNAISTLQNLPGAFDAMIRMTENKYKIDYTLIDLNPGMSAINQNLFLVSNAFIVPTNPDPFSMMALDTLRVVLPRWSAWKAASIDLFKDSAYPMPDGRPKFIGSLIQRFNIRNGRAAKPYRDNIAEIQEKITVEFVPTLHNAAMDLSSAEYGELTGNGYTLGEIPDFQGLLPKAHDAGVPVFAIKNSEIHETGPVLAGLQEKRKLFKKQFESISSQVIEKADYA
jgi:chromosome partitioning protein